ncbi:hypothetical protein [Desulfitobacterium sp. AusDCA]
MSEEDKKNEEPKIKVEVFSIMTAKTWENVAKAKEAQEKLKDDKK